MSFHISIYVQSMFKNILIDELFHEAFLSTINSSGPQAKIIICPSYKQIK